MTGERQLCEGPQNKSPTLGTKEGWHSATQGPMRGGEEKAEAGADSSRSKQGQGSASGPP